MNKKYFQFFKKRIHFLKQHNNNNNNLVLSMWKLTLGYGGSRLANARKVGWIRLIACQYLNKEMKESGHQRGQACSDLIGLLTSELWYFNWIACNWESWIKNRGWSSSQVFRASPMVLSMWLQRVKFIVKKAKCASSL